MMASSNTSLTTPNQQMLKGLFKMSSNVSKQYVSQSQLQFTSKAPSKLSDNSMKSSQKCTKKTKAKVTCLRKDSATVKINPLSSYSGSNRSSALQQRDCKPK
jgi:hypothetical protein